MLSFFQFMKKLCSCCFIKKKKDVFENISYFTDESTHTDGTMTYHFAKL